MLKEVKRIRGELKRIGCRKLYHMLKPQLVDLGYKIGRDKFFCILRSNKLLVRKRSKVPKTTYSRHRYIPHENLLKDFTPQQPKEAVVADITYIKTRGGFAYLFLVTDYFSRCIVGYHLSRSLSHEGAIQAVTSMLTTYGTFRNAIHHTDRGGQYCCHKFIQFLERAGIKPSHTDNDHAAQNAIAERVNGILKDEFFLDLEFLSFDRAKREVAKAIRLYNNKRIHYSLGLRTPANKFFTALPKEYQELTWFTNLFTEPTATVNII